MKLSVVIANYNNAHYLGQCLAAIESQQQDTLEVVVVDDASTDGSVKVIEQLQSRYSNLRLVSLSENHGPLYARLRGVEAAKGDAICFIDPDDTFQPGQLAIAWQLYLDNLKTYQSPVTFFGYHVVWPRRKSEYLPTQK